MIRWGKIFERVSALLEFIEDTLEANKIDPEKIIFFNPDLLSRPQIMIFCTIINSSAKYVYKKASNIHS